MKTIFDNSGTLNSLQKLSDTILENSDVKSLLVFGCDDNGWTPEEIDPILKALPKPVFGGIFPKIIYGLQVYDQGVLVIGLPYHPDILVISELSNPEVDYNRVLESPSEKWMEQRNEQNETIIVFVDGLSKRIASLVEALFMAFGLERNFIGGGAGSLSFNQKPCLITPEGLIMDAGLVVKLNMQSGVGVAHGWQPISESMKVTQSDRNTILSLDWIPAFDRYCELVESHSGKTVTADNYFSIAKGYPFGINKLGGEVVVRDPLTTDGRKGLICVGEVPTGSFVHLLNGTPDTLIAAALKARQLAEETCCKSESEKAPVLFIDCISRVLFLEELITEELAVVAGKGELFGAMTLGEIANNGRDYLEFYNKTSVVALLNDI